MLEGHEEGNWNKNKENKTPGLSTYRKRKEESKKFIPGVSRKKISKYRLGNTTETQGIHPSEMDEKSS